MIIFDIKANSFLYNMVRKILGAMIEIGCYNQEAIWIKELIKEKKQLTSKTVDPQGLYLIEVGYPKNCKIKAYKNVF